jgi:RNA polymerase-binding transcription factor DksA
MLGNTEDEGDLDMIGQDRKPLLTTLQQRDLTWLTSVSEAVERIDNGHYGECLSCGQDIDEETLDAIPWVPFCHRCPSGSIELEIRE